MANNARKEYTDLQNNVQKPAKKKMRGRDRAVFITAILLIIASLGIIGGVVLLKWRPLVDPNNGMISSQYYTPPEIKEKSVNFLICGVDFEENTSRAKLTDVIMVVNFDIQGKKVNVLQIPRDTFVEKETSTGKINAVYGRSKNGGMAGLAEVIHQNLKLPIDHYATVTMTAFRKIIDELGGVQVNVPQRIVLENVTIEPGLQTLDGLKSERFVRERYIYADGDLGRVKMQRLFMAGLAKKLTSIGTNDLFKIITKVMGDVTTDMSVQEVMDFAGVMQTVDISNMNVSMLPGEGYEYYSNGHKQSCYALHKEKTAELLNLKFRPYQDAVPAGSLGIIEPEGLQYYSNYEDNDNDFDDLLNGQKPGAKGAGSEAGN